MMKISEEALRREYALREARVNFGVFVLATMPTFEMTWFHKKVCEALNDLSKGKIKKLMIFMPPQHGKSEMATRRLAAYLLGILPDLKIAIASYNSTKAEKFNREIQRIVDDAAYKEVFPNTNLSNGNDGYSRNNIELEIVGHKGGIRSVGVNGSLTGETVDFLILDDVYSNAMEAWSALTRSNVENWHFTVAETRLHNDSLQLFVSTRWHELDLCGALLAIPDHGWTVISYPAIKVGEPTEDDPREEGEALYPAKHNIEKLMAARSRDPHAFESLYQQNPQPKEGLLYSEFKTYTVLPSTATVRKCYVDTADRGSDYLCSIAYIEDRDAIYVLDIIYTQAGMEITEPLTAKQMQRFKVTQAYIESNNGGIGFGRNVERLTRELGNHITKVIPFTQSLNKVARIHTNQTTVNNLIVFPEGWESTWPIFYNHVTNFSAIGKNAHDDCADTLTGIIEKFATKRGLGIKALSI